MRINEIFCIVDAQAAMFSSQKLNKMYLNMYMKRILFSRHSVQEEVFSIFSRLLISCVCEAEILAKHEKSTQKLSMCQRSEAFGHFANFSLLLRVNALG